MSFNAQDLATLKDELTQNPAGLAYNTTPPWDVATATANRDLYNAVSQDGPVPTLTIRAYCDIEKHAGPGAGASVAALLTNIDRLANEEVPFSAAEYAGAKEAAYPSYVDAAKTFLRKLVDLTGPDIDFTNPFNATTNPTGSIEAENNIAILNTLAEAGAGAISNAQRDAIIAFKDLIQLVETGQESFKPGQQTPRRGRNQKRGTRTATTQDVINAGNLP